MMKRVLIGCLAAFLAAAAFAGKPEKGATRQLTYAGLPTITYTSNSDGQVTVVSTAGRQIISYDWTASPYRVPLRFFDQWVVTTSVLPDGSAAQDVVDSQGARRSFSAILANGRQHARQTAMLDAFAADADLSPGWQQTMETTSANEVRVPASGTTITIRYHEQGQGVRVAEVNGKPVLWDIDLPLGVNGRLGQLVPSRLIVTSTGAVQLAADIPFVDGIESLWTNDPSGDTVSVRTLRSGEAVGSSRVRPLLRMLCDATYVCSYSSGCPSCGGCSTTYYYCDINSGGFRDGDGDPGGGGGPTPPPVDPEITQLQSQYANCPPTPAVSDFITSAQYVNPGHFSFGELSDPNYNHAIITGALTGGLEQTRTNYGGSIEVNSGYRAPGTNAGTAGSAGCSDHIFGTAADLNIRNATGAHDCAVWDALALAGHNAGAWVEPWSELVQRGTPNHVHLDFGRTANQPADYGTCNPSEVSP